MNRDKIELQCLNPNAIQLLRFITDATKRIIIFYGGSSSGKSYSIVQVLILMTFIENGNSLVMRKVGASISKSLFEDFRQAIEQLGVGEFLTIRYSSLRIVNTLTGARIDFCGLDDPEKIKGVSNYRWVFMDEWSEFDEGDFKQIRKRLRGREGQQIITAFNPISENHWIKKKVIDGEEWHDLSMSVRLGRYKIPDSLTQVKSLRINSPKSILNPRTKEVETHEADTVLIQSTYLNNFWVVGSPDGTYGYYDEQCIADFEKDRLYDPDYYNVYALGEWGVIHTGSEFFHAFNIGRHTAAVEYNPSLPIHLSIDNNVLPYISVTYWQCDLTDGVSLRQIAETCAENPDNSARKSGLLTAKRLKGMGYCDKLYVHGDASTRHANTIDDEKRSFLDKFISTLAEEGFDVVDCVGVSNPSVSLTGDFINAIWEDQIQGLSISIGDECKKSIEDYQCVQKDANGAIKKTKVKDKATGASYEEHGHLSDCLRYACYDLMREHYIKFSNRRKRNLFAQEGSVHFFNPSNEYEYDADTLYCMPNLGGRFTLVYGRRCGDRWHIVDVAYSETASTEQIKERLNGIGCSPTYVETAKSYYPFVRELRAEADYTVKVVPEDGDIDRRIAATSDYIKSNILFSEELAADSEEYAAFLEALLDYNKDSKNKEASAVLSGFAKMAIKNF